MRSSRGPAGRQLTDEDRHLWNRISETVTPLRSHRPDASQASPPDRPAPDAGRGERGPFPDLVKDRSAPVGSAVSRIDQKTARKLSRGRIEIDARIDLHGMTQTRAHAALQRFLEMASRRGDRIVLVITGKGRESGGILRRAVPLWLEERNLRALAAAWREANPAHGGEGALYVRLRKRTG
jgi:DNA-nicking Smr family endonuclease